MLFFRCIPWEFHFGPAKACRYQAYLAMQGRIWRRGLGTDLIFKVTACGELFFELLGTNKSLQESTRSDSNKQKTTALTPAPGD